LRRQTFQNRQDMTPISMIDLFQGN